MQRDFTPEFKNGFFTALYEYLIITVPVGIYVILESLHKHDWRFFFKTPEWSIATIFLSFISISRYKMTADKNNRKVSTIFGIMSIISLVIIFSAAINAYISLESESIYAIAFRGILFFVTTIKFFIFLTGTKYIKPDKSS